MKLIVLFLMVLTLSSQAQVNMIYDDDNTGDTDGILVTLPAIHKLADHGEINLLGMMADTTNAYAAPAMRVMANYYNRPTLPIGTFQGTLPCTNTCNDSSWTQPFVGAFNPGDTSSNYTSCISLYRSLLASHTNVVIVETGMMTCLNGLLTSPADGISSMTGAQLIKASVSEFVIMGGYNPAGGEFNFESDPPDTANFFSTVTNQNGYPPIWMIAYGNGVSTDAGPTYYGGTTYPAEWVANQSGGAQRPVWDALAVLFGARGMSYGGTTYFSDAGDGTQTVNATTGANSWSTSTASGQHYLNNVASTTVLSNVFDGYSYAYGFSSMPPGNIVYIGQSVAGIEDGSACANSKAYSYFNTSGYWIGSQAGFNVIQPGESVVLCGTVTSGITAQASGTSGNPIIVWGNPASLAEVNMNGQNYIDLVTPSGTLAGASISGGKLQ